MLSSSPSWSSLKYELVYHQRIATYAQARTAIFDYIETFYNRTRCILVLTTKAPINFEGQQARTREWNTAQRLVRPVYS
jgi:transposase InsO family protein